MEARGWPYPIFYFKFFACHDISRWPRKYCHWLSMCYSLKLLKQRQQMTKFVIKNRWTLKHFVIFSNALKRVRTSASSNAIVAQPQRLQPTVRTLARYIPFSSDQTFQIQILEHLSTNPVPLMRPRLSEYLRRPVRLRLTFTIRSCFP